MVPLPPGASILQVLPRLEAGGVERGTLEMASAIAAAGGRAVVASAGGRLVPLLERGVERMGRHVVLPLNVRSPYAIWRNGMRLGRVIRDERVQLVHARSRGPAWSALRAARAAKVPFVTTYHGVYSEGSAAKRWYNSVMARGDRVIAISRHVAAHLVERHGTDPAIVRVIPRGVDPAVFDPGAVRGDRIARLAAAWRLPDGAPVVMLPARLTRWKGQAVLLEAMALLQHEDAVCVLLGDGREGFRRELLDQAASLGIGARLRLVGHCDDMPAALLLATVAVSASLEPEGFGRAVIEAQAMGCAVIATDHGGAAETVENLVTGWLVPPRDAGTLASVIDVALGMSDVDRAGLGARARDSVLAQYTMARMQAATLDVYRELL